MKSSTAPDSICDKPTAWRKSSSDQPGDDSTPGAASALLCALAYLSAGYVFRHGTSFRFDPPATALLMSAAWITLCRPLQARWIAATGLLLGIATVLTIKSVLYFPVFAGIAWLRWTEAQRSIAAALRLAAIGLAAIASLADRGLTDIVAIDLSATRRRLAKTLGPQDRDRFIGAEDAEDLAAFAHYLVSQG